MRTDDPVASRAGACCPLVTERNRYFTGKYLTARDFAVEQDYLRSRLHLHNRLLHGWGVVCGYDVTPHPDRGCPDWVVVGPGSALDCCGRELVLPDRQPVRIEVPAGYPSSDRRFLLSARYCEELIEPVPVIYDDEGCDPRSTEANRVRETVALDVRPFADVGPSCWAVPSGDGGYSAPTAEDPHAPCRNAGCLEPDCPCGDLVPLALITVAADGGLEIDTGGRRRLPPPRAALTHITDISWTHGGTMTVDELVAADGKLMITFDREIAEADGIATGINTETLLVQHAGEGDDLEFVPYDSDHPPYLDQGCQAVFVVDPGFLSPRRRGGLAGSTVYVTLLADFVLDCHQLPVDGNHLGGRLPSGNGSAGGSFHSWFRIGGSDRPGGYGQEAS